MRKILVSHPGLQHSHQLALAIYENNMLLRYISGVPVKTKNEKSPFFLPNKFKNKIKNINIPAWYRKHPVWPQLLLKLWPYIHSVFQLPGDFETSSHIVFHWFDFFISKVIKKNKPDIVIAFENSAYYSFRMAKSIGAICILDAPSIHYSQASSILGIKSEGFREKINRKKDLEIAMADIILTCSDFALETYVNYGVPREKLKVLYLGSELPQNLVHKWRPHKNELHFVFAGTLRELKSINEILDACRLLNNYGYKFKMTFVGGASLEYINKVESVNNCDYINQLPQNDLYTFFSSCDCLLLPSKFDSFGMVVAEAMSCGTPVIVSTMTGAKTIVEQFPGSGWIVEPTTLSIYEQMKYCIENREIVFSARGIAKLASNKFTWELYRKNIGKIINELLTTDEIR